MDEPADVSGKKGPGWYLLDGCVSTRNRKVEGSNPSSGSETAGQRAFLALLTARRQQAVIPLGWIIAPQGHPPRFGRRCAARLRVGRTRTLWGEMLFGM